jgi:hypothetical protein
VKDDVALVFDGTPTTRAAPWLKPGSGRVTALEHTSNPSHFQWSGG